MAKLAFIGLGVMGFPMAGHLAAKGHELTVYNRTAAKAQEWVKKHGHSAAPTPAAAAQGAEIVFACVGNDDDLRAVTIGPDGAFASMAKGAIFVDHTTASADVARELQAKAAALGISFIDAPVSGGQAGAENGVLTVMCGGDQVAYAKAEPVIAAFARACRLMGGSGAGPWAAPARGRHSSAPLVPAKGGCVERCTCCAARCCQGCQAACRRRCACRRCGVVLARCHVGGGCGAGRCGGLPGGE
jgi:3-hydroxyisobutyrate dehydrogenase